MGKRAVFYLALIIFMIIAPFVFPVFKTQLATVWLMIIVALTWDMTGGQMGYNSLWQHYLLRYRYVRCCSRYYCIGLRRG